MLKISLKYFFNCSVNSFKGNCKQDEQYWQKRTFIPFTINFLETLRKDERFCEHLRQMNFNDKIC